MSLGQRIQELRKRAGLSQEALGEKLGVSRQAVSKWEGDGGVPELDTLIAMSRLFGVTLGELLGVEHPNPQSEDETQDESASGISEEQLEKILRRYTEETRRQNQALDLKKRREWLAVGCVAIVILFFLGLQVSNRFSDLGSRITNLSNRINNVESNVDYSIGNLSESIREILAEQDNLLSTADVRVIGFDAHEETVTVEIKAALKTYTPGTQAQFTLGWQQVDGTEGETRSDWVEGPEFTAVTNIPMNHQLQLAVRLQDTQGVIQEQTIETYYSGMHPDNFTLQAYNLFKAFSFHVGSSVSAVPDSPEGEDVAAVIFTGSPELFYPVSAVLIAERNGEEFCRSPLSLRKGKEPTEYYGSMENNRLDLHLAVGDDVIVRLEMTDNLGRSFVVEEGRTATQNGFEKKPVAVAQKPYG